MPDISITDDLGTPVESVKIDLSQPSSLVNYARAQLLHLIVVPDFLALQDKALSVAAPKPIQFQARLGNDFALGTAATPDHAQSEGSGGAQRGFRRMPGWKPRGASR